MIAFLCLAACRHLTAAMGFIAARTSVHAGTAAGRQGGALATLIMAMAAVLTMAAPPAHAENDFLPPEQAFPFSASMVAPNTVRLDFPIAAGYYMYRERFAFAVKPAGAATLGTPVIRPGKAKYDPTFEKNMEVYHRPVSIRVPLGKGAASFTLLVAGQGCADKGICYPPMTHTVSLRAAPGGGYTVAGTGTGPMTLPPGALSLGPSGDNARQGATPPSLAVSSDPAAEAPLGFSAQPESSGELAGLTRADDVGLADAISGMGWLKAAGLFFLLGILLSLTPCVLPMIPILSSLIVGQRGQQAVPRRRGFGLAMLYVLGMSLVYTALGVAAGLSGVGLAAWLQTPWVLVLFAALLAVLALAMFDVFTFQAPTAMQGGLARLASRFPGGRGAGVFAMGAISALIVGPCVAAPLAGALLYISQTGDVVLGAAALFALAWGMGVPLLAVGASAGALVPRAGAWMEGVKRLFGMLLLATALWMVVPLLATWAQMLGWAALGVVGAVMLRAFEPLPEQGGTARMFAKGLGLLLALCAVVLLVGAASGGRDVLRPLAHLAAGRGGIPGALPPDSVARAESSGAPDVPVERTGSSLRPGPAGSSAGHAALQFVPVHSVAELDRLLAQAGRPAMLDFYADWCVSCREMEQFTFSDPAVAARLSSMLLLRADVTANSAEDRALLGRFRLFGPPGIMFFGADGRQLPDIRVIGFQDAGRFAGTLDRAMAP